MRHLDRPASLYGNSSSNPDGGYSTSIFEGMTPAMLSSQFTVPEAPPGPPTVLRQGSISSDYANFSPSLLGGPDILAGLTPEGLGITGASQPAAAPALGRQGSDVTG